METFNYDFANKQVQIIDVDGTVRARENLTDGLKLSWQNNLCTMVANETPAMTDATFLKSGGLSKPTLLEFDFITTANGQRFYGVKIGTEDMRGGRSSRLDVSLENGFAKLKIVNAELHVGAPK